MAGVLEGEVCQSRQALLRDAGGAQALRQTELLAQRAHRAGALERQRVFVVAAHAEQARDVRELVGDDGCG